MGRSRSQQSIVGPDADLGAAVAHQQAGRLAEAEKICRAILAAEPRNAGALNLLGMIAYQTGQTEPALTLMRQAAAANPRAAAIHGNLGAALLGLGRFAEAAESYQKAADLDPRNELALGNFGFALQQDGRLDEAMTAYRKLLDAFPGHPGALVSIGTVLREQNRLDEAATVFRDALTQQPDFPAALSNLAGVLQEQGELEEAVALYDKALALEPGFVDALINLGHALKELGRTEEALERYRAAVAADPDNADAHYNFGVLLQNTGDIDGAVRHQKAAVARDPKHLRAYWALQECHLLKNQPQETLKYCDVCVGVFPDNQISVANRAIAHLLLGEVERFDYLYDLVDFPRAAHIVPPADYGDITAFNDALAADILAHDSLKWQHDDYQTTDRAFAYGILEAPTPAIGAFESALRDAIDAFIAGIDADPDHPFLGKAPGDYAFKMWATVLRDGGWHRAHSHEDAWLSGVYYVRAPVGGDTGETGRAGWIRFDGFTHFGGNAAYGDRVREVKPEEGVAFFFPSYMLHQTNPLASTETRISIAFDLQPRR